MKKLPSLKSLGALIRDLLDTAVSKYPDIKNTAEDILAGNPNIRPLDEEVVKKVKRAVMILLAPSGVPEKSAHANTPIDAEVMWGWAEQGDDPDGKLLAEWLRKGAPLGFEERIPSTGIFPKTTGLAPVDGPSEAELARPLEEWSNWPSAQEEAQDLHRLIREAESKGFCRVVESLEEAETILGKDPIWSKLGVVVKFQGEERKKKSRIIWDLKESKVNEKCEPGERVVLPRLMDAVRDCEHLLRKKREPVFVAVDIQDAFHNVPAASDKRFTAGRFAALLGRYLMSIVPEITLQIYVDDPLMAIPNEDGQAVRLLTVVLLATKILGYPIKLEKAKAGKSVQWIGAELLMDEDDQGSFVQVSIPKEKIDSLLQEIERFLKAPVIGVKQLRAFAGAASFVAGLVPIMRPFLNPIWASLSKDVTTDEGGKGSSTFARSRTAGKLVHTKRVALGLHWIQALLKGERGALKRRFNTLRRKEGWELVTDACPWGMGGVLYQHAIPMRWFATDLPAVVLDKFKASKGDPAFNTAWEALALLIGLRLWLPGLSQRCGVRVKSDNVGALRMLFNLSSPSVALNVIAREVALDLAGENFQLSELAHIPGLTNVTADALSRLWAPDPMAFPNMGDAIQDLVPDLGPTFWKV